MKNVDLYHLVGVVSLLLLVLFITLGANDGVVLVVGVGIIVILLLGVHIVLDKQDRQMERMSIVISRIELELIHIRTALDFDLSVKPKDQATIIDSLVSINRMINEMRLERKDLSLDEIKEAMDGLKKKIEEFSLKSSE